MSNSVALKRDIVPGGFKEEKNTNLLGKNKTFKFNCNFK